MSVRNLEYTVSLDGITPSTEQFAGFSREINVTKLRFDVTELKKVLYDESNLYYRFDSYDNEGNVINGVSQAFESSITGGLPDAVTHTLPKELIRLGGRIQVYLIITKITNEKTEVELYNFPARLRLYSLPDGKEVKGEDYESLTTLSENTKKYANSAVEAADKVERAATGLDGSNVYIFDGGDDEEDDTEIELDEDVTDEAIENSVVPFSSGGAFNLKKELEKEIENKLSDEKFEEKLPESEALKKTLSDFKKELLNSIFPINKVVTFHDNGDHSNFLGFTWERFSSGRTLIGCGNNVDKNKESKNFTVGESGGEYNHTLTIEELPAHNHKLHFSDSEGTYAAPQLGGEATEWGEKPNTISNTGGNKAHNNLQPYIVTSFWIRVE